jgi:hypothetical protein
MPLFQEPKEIEYVMGQKQWELFVDHYHPHLLPIWPTVSHGYRQVRFEDFDIFIGSQGIVIYTKVNLDWIYERYPHHVK